MKKYLNEIQSALMTGVSYMLPFVLSGGILIGLSYIIGGVDVGSLDSYSTIANGIWNVGQMAFGLMCPALGAYIAFALGDRGAIAAGLVGGLYAREMGAGFLGAMIAGLIAGYLVRMLKNLPVPGAIRGALATVIVPVISVLCVGFIMVYIFGNPLAALSEWLTQWLESISTGSAILIGLVTGAMYAFDLGGPVNKAAYAFGLACLEAGNWVPICASAVACIAPQFSVLLAMLICRKHFSEEELLNIPGLIVGTLFEITEFAIPFAAKDLRVIPCFMLGSGIGSALIYVTGVSTAAPGGGLFVYTPLCSNPFLFLLFLLIAALISAVGILFLRRNYEKKESADIKAEA